MMKYTCPNDTRIKGNKVKAFAHYCIDFKGDLGDYGLTLPEALTIAGHLAKDAQADECRVCRQSLEKYIAGVVVSDCLDYVIGTDSELEPISFEKATSADMHESCKRIQDSRRLALNRGDDWYGTIVTVSKFIGSQSREEKHLRSARSNALCVIADDRGFPHQCIDINDLKDYRDGKPMDRDMLSHVYDHLCECDICAQVLEDLDELKREPETKEPKKKAG